MQKMHSKEIRQKWLDFFQAHHHLVIPTASLVPHDDPSLLWINSGVATLKDYFSGKKNPPSKRLVNSQKAIRTNDIQNIGKTARHHTFFEMLGNFSIGDYFKEEALALGLEVMTKVYQFPLEKLYFTYFDEDQETKEIWLKLGVPKSHLVKGNRKTNFWDVGFGPCGPNSEIFYDRGTKFDTRGIELLENDLENDRYIEIYNIVFSTFNNDGNGNYEELSTKNIDTGAGLERITAILQKAPTNYDTDLFQAIIQKIASLSQEHYRIENYFLQDPEQKIINSRFQIIADHMRSAVNAIADGAVPSNVGRGYIIRSLIRRAYRNGISLKMQGKAFLYQLVEVIKSSLVFDYDVKKVSAIIQNEEHLFAKTIQSGKILLEKKIANLETIDFAFAFHMFETYGYPIELTQDILAEKGITLDTSQFEAFRQEHARKSTSSKFLAMKKMINSLETIKEKLDQFIGYEVLDSSSKVIFLANEHVPIQKGEGNLYFILDKTPFYATSGGQKHDQGYILYQDQQIPILNVFKDKWGNHIHEIHGQLAKNAQVEAVVNVPNRRNLERNHSATHLLFCALRTVFGPQIKQLGSNNNENHLTFDYPANRKPTKEELQKIEDLMHHYISLDVKREYHITNIQKARELGAIITIEETEYMDPQHVRLVQFAGITSDLCGGTHTSRTANLEDFKITSVENKGTGVYRISAITTHKLVKAMQGKLLFERKNALLVVVKKIQQLNKDFVYHLEEKEASEKALVFYKQEYFKLQKILKNEIKQSQRFDLERLKLKSFKIKEQEFIVNAAESVTNLVGVSALIREKHPQAVVISLKKLGPKTQIILTSKDQDVKKIWQQMQESLLLKGGGNALLMQGISNTNLNQKVLEEFLNA